jgi:hypothetical protein
VTLDEFAAKVRIEEAEIYFELRNGELRVAYRRSSTTRRSTPAAT